jgi:hypothetical protein
MYMGSSDAAWANRVRSWRAVQSECQHELERQSQGRSAPKAVCSQSEPRTERRTERTRVADRSTAVMTCSSACKMVPTRDRDWRGSRRDWWIMLICTSQHVSSPSAVMRRKSPHKSDARRQCWAGLLRLCSMARDSWAAVEVTAGRVELEREWRGREGFELT